MQIKGTDCFHLIDPPRTVDMDQGEFVNLAYVGNGLFPSAEERRDACQRHNDDGCDLRVAGCDR